MDLINFEKEKRFFEKSFIFSKNLVLYRLRAKELSNLVITSEGLLNFDNLKALLKTQAPSYGLLEQEEYLKNLFGEILEDKILQNKITIFDFPIHENFENMVRLTLGLRDEILTKSHLRKAVIASLFGYLRQTVGSCFATAPCLYILKRHPDYFLEDLYLLSKKGCLQRLSHGQLIEVPMAAGIGSHFLSQTVQKNYNQDSVFVSFCEKNNLKPSLEEKKTFLECIGEKLSYSLYAEAHDPLLKIWEYTVASLCDAKGEFTESTIYLTLGLDAKMPDGLGEFFLNSFQKSSIKNMSFLFKLKTKPTLPTSVLSWQKT